MVYRNTGQIAGDEAFRVGADRALEEELGRWSSDPDRSGDVDTGPMFSIKADTTGGSDIYAFRGSDMDRKPLVH